MMDLNLERALTLVAAARRLAGAHGVAMTFAVVDEGGHLIALERMDGAAWATVEIAIGKAWTASAWRSPSADQAAKARALPQFAAAISVASHGRYTPQDGGLPVVVDGAVLGGAGASGGTGQQDAEILAQALAETLS
jgi:uncharacterized protein GlcG (DUF336 family)